MISKKERTMEMYMLAGAEARLLKCVINEFYRDASRLMYAKDSDKVYQIINKLNPIISELEEQMFRDYPELSNEYIHVFYGALRGKPIDNVDTEIYKVVCDLIDTIQKRLEEEKHDAE